MHVELELFSGDSALILFFLFHSSVNSLATSMSFLPIDVKIKRVAI